MKACFPDEVQPVQGYPKKCFTLQNGLRSSEIWGNLGVAPPLFCCRFLGYIIYRIAPQGRNFLFDLVYI